MAKGEVRSKEQQFLRVFQQVTRLTAMVMDHHQVVDTIVRSLPDLLEVDACSIRLLDGASGSFVLAASHGLSAEYLNRQVIDSRETLAMIRKGRPVARGDSCPGPSALRDAACREGIKSVLSLPIVFQESIIGIMRLLTRSNREFSQEEIDFAMALAEQVGIAIANGRMLTAMENQVDFLKEVQDLSKLLNSNLDLEAVLQTIVERVPCILQTRGCTLRLLNPQTNRLELVASSGLSDVYLDRGDVESEINIHKVLSGEPVAVYDVLNDKRVFYKKHMEEEGICSLLAIPVKKDREIIGVMRILSTEHRVFTASEINYAVTVAEVGGTAIQNARNFRKINLLFNQIEEHERFLGNILDCLKPQLLVLDRNRHVVLANRTFLEQVGRSEAEVLGMEYRSFCTTAVAEGECPVDRVFRTGQTASIEQQICRNNRQGWVERSATPMHGEDGRVDYVIEVIRDITASRQLEAEKMERCKLEGVIELAGTVAHEINTPLFAALGTAQLMEEDFEDREQLAGMQTIVRNLQAIKTLTGKMTSMTGFSQREYVGSTRIIDL